MAISIKLVALFGFLNCLVSTCFAIYVEKQNSLFGPYEDYKQGSLVFWDLTGNAQLADHAIRLTTDEPEKQGAIWNTHPVFINDWEFHLHFHVHGKGVHDNGNGLAFWYVREPLQLGPVFGSKDYFSGLGIFIDTVEDHLNPHHHKHPYISAVVNNGSQAYGHDATGTWGQVGGCHVQVRNLEWPTKMAISYISDVLTVFVDSMGTQSWQECFKANIRLPTGNYFGLSASTGSQYSDNHDIVSVTSLQGLIENRVWEDRNFMLPVAEHLEVPFKHVEVGPEEFHKAEAIDTVKEEKVEAFEQPKPEKKGKGYDHISPPQVEAPESQTAEAATSVSFTRKVVYVAGVVVILIVAVGVFRQYSARRKERMQKRLF